MRTLLAAFALLVLTLPARAQGIELEKIVQAPGVVPLGEGVKVGYRYERTTKVQDQVTREWLAVVGETKDAWEIETNQILVHMAQSMPDAKGARFALVVDKKTHQVLVAKLGKPGAPLKEARIMQMALPKQQEKPKPSRSEDLAVGEEKIPADVYVTEIEGVGTMTSYVGKRGSELEGMLLKMEGPQSYELKALPKEESFELEDEGEDGKKLQVVARRAEYTNGQSITTCKHPVAKAFNLQHMLEYSTPVMTMKIVSLRTDAKKTLTWGE
ncbi:MAG TPA: hypothetical protein DEA08_21420 [Planctomycetes bacterium]|nr:hypothetical protein [Planctomycetota bacterium]